jgi:aminopeptidase N
MRGMLMLLTLAFFLIMPLVSSGAESMPVNDLTVRFDIEHHTLRGLSKITLPPGRASELDLAGLKVLSIKVNGSALSSGPNMKAVTIPPGVSADTVEIEYEVRPQSAPLTDNEKNPGVVYGNSIDASGIVLSGGWYPSVGGGLSLFNFRAVLPDGFEGISEADEVSVKDIAGPGKEYVFSFPHPVGGITFAAGKYVVQKDSHGATEIIAYFLPEDAGLSKTYIEYTKKYIEMYEKLIGKYPFKRFAVVENVLPTGYSLPTYTLLGRDVVRLPFIVETSLGHEILHQWFGNSVYVDYSGGNWSEGLTTYLADHRYEELKGKGREYRKETMISFENYVTAENDFPLAAFTGRSGNASKAIGYGKSAMVFHMLRKMVGEEIFYRSISGFAEKNRFRAASWSDIRSAFESAFGKDLSWFFKQWVEGKGAPEIGVRNPSLAYRGATAAVSFEIAQKDDLRLPVPVKVELKEGETGKMFEVAKKTTALEIETEGTPVRLIIDDNYDLFRRLSNDEFPPVISRLFGDTKKIFVLPKGREEEYADVAAYLKGEGFSGKNEEEVNYDDLKASSVLIFGVDSPVARGLFGEMKKTTGDFSIIVRKNPYSNSEVIAIAEGNLSHMEGYLRRITHYGKYSRLSFRDGKNVLKETDASRKGIDVMLSEDVPGVDMRSFISLADIAEKAGDKKIVYVGEVHNKFEHHRAQYEILRGLYGRNKKIIIGMEMFQKPFQKALDDYISGAIEEKEFLKRSEYFKRWGFDYLLYREILLFAREYKIPVAALNIRNEIVTKVGKEGLLSLTADERKEVPQDMDLSDLAYKERLRKLFEGHRNSESRNFDFFYEAQVLWDESMAHNLVSFMRENPGHQAVVIVGMGHLSFGSGIPKRAYRLNGEDYSVILNDADMEKGIAEFMLFPSPIRPPEAPKLMVVLKEEEGKVRIQDFAQGSVSEKAGLKKGDIIIALDDTKIEGIDDVKIFLLYKKKGDAVNVRVIRDRFLLGPQDKTFTITF